MALRCRIRYPMSKTQYRIRYRTFFKWTLFPAGPAPHPSAAPSDAGDNRPWNSDDERDFAEHAYSPPSPMSHYPGSLNPFLQFLSHIPDWNLFDKSALDHAAQACTRIKMRLKRVQESRRKGVETLKHRRLAAFARQAE